MLNEKHLLLLIYNKGVIGVASELLE